MLWIVNTFYTTLSKNDWSNGKNSRTKVVVLAVVGTPVPPPPLLALLLLLLGLLEPSINNTTAVQWKKKEKL
jgi:hypothetical protein